MNSYRVLILLLVCRLSWCVDMRPSLEMSDPSPYSTPGKDCPISFEDISGRCILIDHKDSGKWSDAKYMCERFQGNLINLKDGNYMADLIDYIKGKGGSFIDYDYWIGGSDEAEEGNWVWLDGSPMRLGTPFWGHQGSDIQAPNGDTNQNCAYLNRMDYYFMDDGVCDDTVSMGSICEYTG